MKKNKESLGEKIIGIVKDNLVVKPLQRFLHSKYKSKFSEEINYLPKGTVGRDLVDFLQENNFKLIPNYESHDLKHLLLGYGMSTLEEIKMQAFLWGNGNHSVLCIGFVISAIILPRKWGEIYNEYKRGKSVDVIIGLRLEHCMYEQTFDLQNKFSLAGHSI